MFTKRFFANVFFFLLFLGFSTLSYAAYYESVVHSVEHFGGDGQCPGDDRLFASTYVNKWTSHMSDWDYDKRKKWTDSNVNYKDFIGSDNVSPYGTDWADAIFVASHGGHYYNGAGSFSYFYMGKGPTDPPTCSNNQCPPLGTLNCCPGRSCIAGICELDNDRTDINELSDWGYDFDSSRAENCIVDTYRMALGDDDADVFIAHTCQSGQKRVWNATGYNSLRSDNHFKMYNAFHGNAKHSIPDYTRWEFYLDATKKNGLGYEWVTEATCLYDVLDDICAVSILWGNNEDDIEDSFYNSGFKDFHSVGSGDKVYAFVEYCDPSGGGKLLPEATCSKYYCAPNGTLPCCSGRTCVGGICEISDR